MITRYMRLIIKGTVQGVGFRPAVYRTAARLGLKGSVCNKGSEVVIDIDDADSFLESFLKELPPLAEIESIEKIDTPLADGTEGFSIVGSDLGSNNGFSIPADTALCDRCLGDLRQGRRKGYGFTACTDCGPRFTLLHSLPYDRLNTAMASFGLCPECKKEYLDPNNRRYHHQTVCCPVCGPRYFLLDEKGAPVDGEPILAFARMLESGKIGIAKSWGGMHICCILSKTQHMREWYGREQKPFAIMVRDIDTVKKYAEPTHEEEKLLLSPFRPIVLVKKKQDPILDRISPGLDNVGIFLPYSAMHTLLFDELKEDALVMTSGNVPGEPMIVDNDAILSMHADCYLLHNQPILNRADDSVVRTFGNIKFYLRKSRGAVPSYIPFPIKGHAVGVGAQESLAGAIATGERIYPTQYIGNGEGVGVPEYLEEAIRFQSSLVGCEPQIVAEDLHPAYINRKFASRFAEEYGAELIEIQHHWAHTAALMTDCGTLEHMTALALDGTGHGDDGMAWGGEVLSCDLHRYKRLAHLEYIPLLGGQKAVTDLRRLRFAIDLMNGEPNNTDFDDSEAGVLAKLMSKSVGTSSLGRILDALSYYLGVCKKRTYDGEPAMKLEPLLARGHHVPGFETYTENGIVKTAHLFSHLEQCKNKADAAYSVVYGILEELVSSATESASLEGDKYIGITGGVSYDVPLVRMVEEIASKHELKLYCHRNIPNGDGGISTGQVAIALSRLR